MPISLTPEGLAIQTGDEIVAEAADAIAALIGADFDASDLTSVEGQIFHVLALREVWIQGGLVDVVDALSIDRAQGRQLEAIGATVLGCLIGFLVFNLPPSSIFMGDVGSTAIGFLLAALPLLPEASPVGVEPVAELGGNVGHAAASWGVASDSSSDSSRSDSDMVDTTLRAWAISRSILTRFSKN